MIGPTLHVYYFKFISVILSGQSYIAFIKFVNSVLGKMFPSNDTVRLAHYLLRHFNEMPCDWLYPKFVEIQPLPCQATPEKYPQVQTCNEELRRLRLRDSKGQDMCAHRGHYSSLKGKVVPVHLDVPLLGTKHSP